MAVAETENQITKTVAKPAIPSVKDQSSGNGWTIYNGDCCSVIQGIPDNSIHFSVFSPPFSELYRYSDDVEDMSNCANDAEFFEHFGYLIAELHRVIMPGRLCSVHCMNLPIMKQDRGYIGLRDFRGDIIRQFEAAGWIFHSEVCIYKDPLIEATRTKSLGLAHKQIVKDSAMCRQGTPDYVCTFRKHGDNPEPVSRSETAGFDRFIGENPPGGKQTSNHRDNKLSHNIWRRYADPVWMDIRQTRVLKDYIGSGNEKIGSKEEDDQKHICSLQLDVIERCVDLWTNPGDVVLSPFMGIGSEGYVSVAAGRKFVGIELKTSYFKVAKYHMEKAEREAAEKTLFDDLDDDGGSELETNSEADLAGKGGV